jgi:F-type H+-transporting ATPase subunit beta
MANIGKITQVIGSTFDAEFSDSNMPAIYNAVHVEIDAGGNQRRLVGEISKHLGGGRVRCVALGSTEGLRRGSDCVDTGSPVMVPVGEETLGRVFNMLGEPVAGLLIRQSHARFTERHRASMSFPPTPSCLRPVLKWSTC